MPDICTATVSPNNCGHRVITVGGLTIHMTESEIVPLSTEEREQMYRLAVRHKGVALAQLLNRVVQGDEATNVKIYSFFGPGAAIAKTNVGATYVNICPGANGERLFVDFTGCTEFRLMLHANLVGVGQFGARVVRDSDDLALYQGDNLGAAGERELDTGWTALPAPFVNAGIVSLRAQAKSTTATDDPVFRALRIGVR